MSILSSNNANLRITLDFLKRRGYIILIGAGYAVYHFIHENSGNRLTQSRRGTAIFYFYRISEDGATDLYIWHEGIRKIIHNIDDLIKAEDYFRKQ